MLGSRTAAGRFGKRVKEPGESIPQGQRGKRSLGRRSRECGWAL